MLFESNIIFQFTNTLLTNLECLHTSIVGFNNNKKKSKKNKKKLKSNKTVNFFPQTIKYRKKL